MKDTRYEVGELVVDKTTGELYNIYKIDGKHTDSPDYHVESQTHLDKYHTEKASNLEKRESQLPHPNDYIIEIGYENIDNDFEGSFWVRVNAPERARIQDNLGSRLAKAMQMSVDAVTGDNMEFWVIGFFRENKDDIQDAGYYSGTYTQGDINHMWEHNTRPDDVPKDIQYDMKKEEGLKPRKKQRMR